MLDDTDFIARFDKGNNLGVIAAQVGQLRHKYAAVKGLERDRIHHIVLAGMGGSALAAEFIKSWLADRATLPIEIVRDYALPAHVGEHTLVVCYSYSGTTEETLAALEEARGRGSQVVVMTSGGRLLETAHEAKLPVYQLPGDVQGRYGVLYGVRAWAQLIEALGVAEGLVDELEAAGSYVEAAIAAWAPEAPTEANEAKQVARELLGHPVVVYGGPVLAAVAMKWKIDFNENAKHLAFWNALPEMNHNEFSGWGHPERAGLKVIELMSELDHPQVVKRFEVMNSLLSSQFAPVQVQAEGKTKLEQMVWTFVLGSYVSAYLAVLNQVDIGALPLVEKLKARLK